MKALALALVFAHAGAHAPQARYYLEVQLTARATPEQTSSLVARLRADSFVARVQHLGCNVRRCTPLAARLGYGSVLCVTARPGPLVENTAVVLLERYSARDLPGVAFMQVVVTRTAAACAPSAESIATLRARNPHSELAG